MEATSESHDPALMHSEPRDEHRWLQQLIGEWRSEGGPLAESGAAAESYEGTERVRSIGDLWIVFEGRGEMPGGGEGTSLLTLGFDPENNRFIGTWVGSMMTHMWIYDGQLDPDRRVLTLESEGPDFVTEGKTARYRDVIEIMSEDHRTLSGIVQKDDGSWHKFMTTHYRRTK